MSFLWRKPVTGGSSGKAETIADFPPGMSQKTYKVVPHTPARYGSEMITEKRLWHLFDAAAYFDFRHL